MGKLQSRETKLVSEASVRRAPEKKPFFHCLQAWPERVAVCCTASTTRHDWPALHRPWEKRRWKVTAMNTMKKKIRTENVGKPEVRGAGVTRSKFTSAKLRVHTPGIPRTQVMSSSTPLPAEWDPILGSGAAAGSLIILPTSCSRSRLQRIRGAAVASFRSCAAVVSGVWRPGGCGIPHGAGRHTPAGPRPDTALQPCICEAVIHLDHRALISAAPRVHTYTSFLLYLGSTHHRDHW